MSKMNFRYIIDTEAPTLGLSLEDKMLNTTMPTLARLHELFNYNKNTGILTRRIGVKGYAKGSTVGTVSNGYIYTKVDGTIYAIHRIVWLMNTGEKPNGYIDHINGIRHDNRMSNLRVVTMQDNNKNLSRQRRNKSGKTGVIWDKTRSRWKAQIVVNYKTINLGRFKNKHDAIKARDKANIKYGFHKNHGRDTVCQ